MSSIRYFLQAARQRLRAPFQASRGTVGTALVEVMVAITIFSVLGGALLSGVWAAQSSGGIAGEQSIAEKLARNQMEYVLTQAYLAPPATYVSIADATDISFTVDAGYAVTALATVYTEGDPAIVTDTNIEKVIVTISRGGRDILALETLRAND